MWGWEAVGWCICRDALSYTEVACFSGLKFDFWFTCQALQGLVKGYVPQTVLETRAAEGPSSREAALTAGGFRAHQQRGETVLKACLFLRVLH